MNTQTKERLAQEAEAMQNCEAVPIHNIPYIQPHGALLGVDISSKIIHYASENISDWLDIPMEEVLGASLRTILPKEIVHQIHNSLCHSTIETLREYIGRHVAPLSTTEIFAHCKGKYLILEFQKVNPKPSTKLKLLDNVQRIVSRLEASEDISMLLENVVTELKAFTGYHRVMAYRFLNDGAGEVVSEALDPQVDSFLGLRFPAMDIPESARKLYTKTPIRILSSLEAEQVSIRSLSENQAPIDLSLALFRGVVPVHALYLKNMGVGATLSLPIVIKNNLWGIFAFHHMSERMLEPEEISALGMISKSIGLLLTGLLHEKEIQTIEDCNRVASSLFVPDDSPLGFSAYWDVAGSKLSELISCDGVGLLSEDRFDTYGTCLSEKDARALAAMLDKLPALHEAGAKPMGIESLEAFYPECESETIAGVLVIPNPALSYKYLLYFRKVEPKIIRWAGKPEKEVYESEGSFRLNPRASFKEFQEQRRSENFTYSDLLVANALRSALSETISSVVTQTHHRERLGLIIRELNHRARNILSLIGSIITQSKGTSNSISEFTNTLEHRLQALSETQKLLTENAWKQIDLKQLVSHALVAYNNYLGNRIQIRGEQVYVPPSLASLLALVINELASNALKYGALSNQQGYIQISWMYQNEILKIDWKEEEGPLVSPPSRHGFGTTLIKEALAYEYGAECELHFNPSGTTAIFCIPLTKELAYGNGKVTRTVRPKMETEKESNSFTALVLEDDYVISREMVNQLKQLGATHVDAAPSIPVARNYIATNNYDIAFLDVNIRGAFSTDIARLLQHKGIPYAFCTGYGTEDQELKNLNSLAILSKPVSQTNLQTIIEQAMLDLTLS